MAQLRGVKPVAMLDRVFFYGTLMTPFRRAGRSKVDQYLTYMGRGTIAAALFDLGIYPAAVPASDSCVWGEIYETAQSRLVLTELDEIEGYRVGEPETSLYLREHVLVTLEDGHVVGAWVYFYNAPLGRAERIASGDYLEHLNVRPSIS